MNLLMKIKMKKKFQDKMVNLMMFLKKVELNLEWKVMVWVGWSGGSVGGKLTKRLRNENERSLPTDFVEDSEDDQKEERKDDVEFGTEGTEFSVDDISLATVQQLSIKGIYLFHIYMFTALFLRKSLKASAGA